jgi:hypothetical protein
MDTSDARLAAWSYPHAHAEVIRISNFVSYEPDIVSVPLDCTQLRPGPGQSGMTHDPDRDLTATQVVPLASAPA